MMVYNRLYSITLILILGLLLTSCPKEDPTKSIEFAGIDKDKKSVKFTMAVTKIDDVVKIDSDVFKIASETENLRNMLSQQKQILAIGNNFCVNVAVDQKNIAQSIFSVQKYFPKEYESLSIVKPLNERRLEFFKYCENYAKPSNKKLIIIGTTEDIDFTKDSRDITGALDNGLKNLNPEELTPIGLTGIDYQLFQLAFPYKYENSDWQSTIIESEDKQGNKAILDIKTLGKGYFWHIGKNDGVDTPASINKLKNGLPISELDKALSNNSFQTLLRASDDIFYVGTASCEGEEAKEETIAFYRANQLLNYTENKHMPPRIPLANSYALTLGQYKPDAINKCPKNKPEDTADQRFIMVIGVKKVNEGEAKKANLCDVLSYGINTYELNNPALSGSFKIKDYSEFTFGSPKDKNSSCKINIKD